MTNLTDNTALYLDGDLMGFWAEVRAGGSFSSAELAEMAAALEGRGSWGFYSIGNAFAEFIITTY